MAKNILFYTHFLPFVIPTPSFVIPDLIRALLSRSLLPSFIIPDPPFVVSDLIRDLPLLLVLSSEVEKSLPSCDRLRIKPAMTKDFFIKTILIFFRPKPLLCHPGLDSGSPPPLIVLSSGVEKSLPPQKTCHSNHAIED